MDLILFGCLMALVFNPIVDNILDCAGASPDFLRLQLFDSHYTVTNRTEFSDA